MYRNKLSTVELTMKAIPVKTAKAIVFEISNISVHYAIKLHLILN